MTDNQQAATLGCYGNTEIRTPNIDRLAADGVKFENAFCSNAFCSPCRASVLTGLMPSQHGVHSWIDDRNMPDWPENWHALSGLRTLPEVLQSQGYRTGIFGKYHLGDPQNPAPGWNSWVTMADGHVRSFYENSICDNGTLYSQPGHSVDFFTDKALDFLCGGTGPAFAYIPLPAPYGHWPATNDGRENRHSATYADCPMSSVPRMALSRAAVDGYDMIKEESGGGLDFSMLMRAPNDLPTLRNYYSQIGMIDDAIGRLIDARPDALIVFTTDHGLSLGHHGFWGHGAATYPSNLHHAAHSIPLIVRQRGRFDGGRSVSEFVSNTDLFATLVAQSGGQVDQNMPSRDLSSLLAGGKRDWDDDEIYAEQEETRVIRTARWTFFKRFNRTGAPALEHALFDSLSDPGETRNLANDPTFSGVVEELGRKIDAYFDRYSRLQANLWNGGKPIQNSMMKRYWREIWGEDWAPVYRYES